MAILRIERAVYAADDVSECARFFDDFGLAPRTVTTQVASFATAVGQVVEVRHADDPVLPVGPESGASLREIVWGVDDQAALDAIAADLARDREVSVDADGTVHTRDETGFGLGFAVAVPIAVDAESAPVNHPTAVQRWNEPLSAPGTVRPLRMCHVAWNVPDAGHREAVEFFVKRLGFRITDDVLPMGAFMQCEGDDDQHNLLLCHRPDRASTNHISFEVRNADEVIVGGNQMIEKGWREARRLGRHTVGSNVFRFIHAPCGGRVELAADMDRVDERWTTRVHESTPPHHLWTLRTNKDGDDQ